MRGQEIVLTEIPTLTNMRWALGLEGLRLHRFLG